MKLCSICKRISATDEDHIDCIQLRKVEMQDEGFKESLPEKLDMAKGGGLNVEIKAVLEHLAREKRDSESA